MDFKEFVVLVVVLFPAFLGVLIPRSHVFTPKRKREAHWIRNYKPSAFSKYKSK